MTEIFRFFKKDERKIDDKPGRVVTSSGHVFYIIDTTPIEVIPPPSFVFDKEPPQGLPDWAKDQPKK
jgi:hypothetical protein